jgi:hypothetical protein
MKHLLITFISLVVIVTTRCGYIPNGGKYLILLAGPPGSGKTSLVTHFLSKILKLSECKDGEEGCYSPCSLIIDEYIEQDNDFQRFMKLAIQGLKAIDEDMPMSISADKKKIAKYENLISKVYESGNEDTTYELLNTSFRNFQSVPINMNNLCAYSSAAYRFIRQQKDYEQNGQDKLNECFRTKNPFIFIETLFRDYSEWIKGLFKDAKLSKGYTVYIIYPYARRSSLVERTFNRAKLNGRYPCESEYSSYIKNIQNSVNLALHDLCLSENKNIDSVIIYYSETKKAKKFDKSYCKSSYSYYEWFNVGALESYTFTLRYGDEVSTFVGTISVEDFLVEIKSYDDGKVHRLYLKEGSEARVVHFKLNWQIAKIDFDGWSSHPDDVTHVTLITHNYVNVEIDLYKILHDINSIIRDE